MSPKREYPGAPVVGVGGVVIREGRALLIKRGSAPLEGQWSIPGGTLELGESLQDGVRRELLEETGIEVRVLELIEVFDRIFRDASGENSISLRNRRLSLRVGKRRSQRRERRDRHRLGQRSKSLELQTNRSRHASNPQSVRDGFVAPALLSPLKLNFPPRIPAMGQSDPRSVAIYRKCSR